jgi:hypothetical protein
MVGFLRASRRCRALGVTPDPDELIIPLSECVWWARSVDEGLEQLDGPTYVADRDSCVQGEHVRGIRFARNRTHDRALTTRKRKGLSFPLTFPLAFEEIVWRPVGELPPPKKPDPKSEAAYVAHLEGRQVLGTLNVVEDWFTLALNRPTSSLGLASWWAAAVAPV